MGGDFIRKARIASGWTQTEFASRIGSRQATVSKLESGEPATRSHVLFNAPTALGLEFEAAKRGGKKSFEGLL